MEYEIRIVNHVDLKDHRNDFFNDLIYNYLYFWFIFLTSFHRTINTFIIPKRDEIITNKNEDVIHFIQVIN